jgi:acyl-CoA thioester hydrolase
MEYPKNTSIDRCIVDIIPRYCETDQAGVVHHSVYPIYFEIGRTELLRMNGLAYKDLEQSGTFFVVARLEVKYRRPALYDEKLQLETVCTNTTLAKVEHTYYLRRDGILLAEGKTALACVDEKGAIKKIPDFMFPQTAQTK